MRHFQGLGFDQDICCLCFGLHGGPPWTFDLDDDGHTVALVPTDICIPCRMNMTTYAIKKMASYDNA